jgi:copper transporter 1
MHRADSECSMLAVMTMNVGYFLSVLGGVFLGSFVMGGWTSAATH